MFRAIGKSLRERDTFGQRVFVAYRGRETHDSTCGGLLSLAVLALTMILIFNSGWEVLFMEEPQIFSYSVPLSREDKQELIPLRFSDYSYTLAFRLSDIPPPQLGYIFAYAWVDGKKEQIIPANCTEVLSQDTIDRSSEPGSSNKFGYDDKTICFTPEDVILSDYSDGIDSGTNRFEVFFKECSLTPLSLRLFGPACWDDEEKSEWEKENFYLWKTTISLYESRTKIAYSEQFDYVSKQMEFVASS